MSDRVKKNGAREAELIRDARAEAEQLAPIREIPPPEEPDVAQPPPDSFTGYTILREIHRGGQGVVYQALQKATKRKVAIKVLREGPFADAREVARFEREVEVLGQLNHPNIVAIHDTGHAAGHCYFVMDYISGQPLDVYMASGERSVRHTLRLFAEICRAVEAAHLRGVIHRDIKPSNIRVDASGVPHILDFGLAKIASASADGVSRPEVMTRTGQFLGSLPWASPEQACGSPERIDIRTDVYSLGVTLYQMLTGRFPYEVVGNMSDILDNIVEATPVRPRAVRRDMDDEVETIVLRTLSKDRERRYQSAGELARDVARYLDGEPIEAKRDSTWYLLRKTLLRHRLRAGVAATFLVLVVAFAVFMSVQYRRATVAEATAGEQRVEAQMQAATAGHVADFLVELFDVADPDATTGRTITAREVLDRGAMRIETELAAAPAVRATLMHVMGRAYLNLGLYGDAERLADAALETRRSLGGADADLAVAESMELLAAVYVHQLRHDEAERLFRAALSAREARVGRGEPSLAATLEGLADALLGQRRYDEAEGHLARALELVGDDRSATAVVLTSMARVRQSRGDFVEAEAILRSALDAHRDAHGGRDHRAVASTLRALAAAVDRNRGTQEAVPIYREAVALYTRLLGEDHPEVASTLRGLANALAEHGEYDEADGHLAHAVEILRAVHGDEHAAVASMIDRRGWVRYRRGDYAAAEQYFREALVMRRRVLPADHPALGGSETGLGAVLLDRGNSAEATRHFERALEVARQAYGNDDPLVADRCANLVAALMSIDDPALLPRAEALIRESLAIIERHNGIDHAELGDPLTKLAWILQCQHRYDEAEEHYRRAVEIRRRHLRPENPAIAYTLIGLGMLLTEKGDADGAEPILREAMDLRRKFIASDHWLQACVASALGECLLAQGRYEEARPLLVDSYDAIVRIRGRDTAFARRVRDAVIALYEALGETDKAEALRAPKPAAPPITPADRSAP